MSTGICQYICVLADLSSVRDREVGTSFLLLSVLLAGLLHQHTLHTSVCLASYNRPDPSVLVAEKSRSQSEYGNAAAQRH